MLLTMIGIIYLNQPEEIRLNQSFSNFPKKIGGWTGNETRFENRIYEVLGVDDSFLCKYYAGDGRSIQLYVGFYQSQREGDLIHSPKHCLPGGGWNITHVSEEDLTVTSSKPQKIKMAKLLIEKGKQKKIVLYWFQSRGRIISSEYMQKIYLVLDSITRRRTDGSFVRLISFVRNGDMDMTTQTMKDFSKLLIPILNQYIPS